MDMDISSSKRGGVITPPRVDQPCGTIFEILPSLIASEVMRGMGKGWSVFVFDSSF